MPRDKGLYAYEERYKLVFKAGGLNWNDPRPNLNLSKILDGLPPNSRCIEFGCGEGFQARFMASKGHRVTAIDLSPTAIAKAIRETPSELGVRFLASDVTDGKSLGLQNASFDLAVDIGCLHMMTDELDRSAYLRHVNEVLKPAGKFFLQNGLNIDDYQPQSDEEIQQLKKIKETNDLPCGRLLLRKVKTNKGEKEIALPLLSSKFVGLAEYIKELDNYGFQILSAERQGTLNFEITAVILVEKYSL